MGIGISLLCFGGSSNIFPALMRGHGESNREMRVLYVASGISVDTSGQVSSLVGRLPRNLKRLGLELSVILPHLRDIDEGECALAERLHRLNVRIDGKDIELRILEGRLNEHVRVFYLSHDILRSVTSLAELDGALGFGLYAQAVAAFLAKQIVAVDVVHCDDIGTCLLPVMMRQGEHAAKLNSVKCLVSLPSIHNQGLRSLDWVDRFGLSAQLKSSEGLEFYGEMSILKGAYLYADAIVLPSKADVDAIFDKDGGASGLEGVLAKRRKIVKAIGTGITLDCWDPSTGRDIGKAVCKSKLAAKLKLSKDPKRPLICFIDEFSAEGGVDLVSDILDDLMDRRAQLVFLGKGKERYESVLKDWREEFSGNLSVTLKDVSEEDLREHLAACDFILMSREQQGQNTQHLRAMRYGCLPIAYLRGSVASDIRNCKPKRPANDSNAFGFTLYDADEFFESAMDAIDVFENAKTHEALVERAMNYEYSWVDCAKAYQELYQKI